MLFDHGKHFDFVLIQETLVNSGDAISALSSRWPGASYWSPAVGRQGGTAILVNQDFQGQVLSWHKDIEVEYLVYWLVIII